MTPDPDVSSQLVFRVRRTCFAVALISYPVGLLPLLVVWLSPRPGVGGWIAFGGLALCFVALSTASLCYALLARVVVRGCELRYEGVWQSLKIDLVKIRSVYPSLKNIVFDVGEKRRLVVPDVFEHREKLLEAIAEAKRTNGASP